MSAILSPCGTYRYALWRTLSPDFWGELDANMLGAPPERTRLYVMLNPSTADAGEDDPTIRRCIGFARRDGFTRICVANLFAVRETDSSRLKAHADPVGPHNDEHLSHLAAKADEIVVAWVARAKITRQWRMREAEVLGLLPAGIMCLGRTGDGSPSHPLFLPNDAPLLPYP